MECDKKKTLLFTLEYVPFKGGVANYYGNLVSHWPDKGCIDVLDNNKGGLISLWLRPRWITAWFALYGKLRTKEYKNLIVGHILPLGWVAYKVTKLIRVPYTVVLHGMDFSYALKTARKKKQAMKILKKAKKIICANSYTAGQVLSFLSEDERKKVKVVNPGINPSNPQSLSEIERIKDKFDINGKVILFSIGRLVKRKGFDMVLDALPEIQNSVPNLHYFIAGDGPDKDYIQEKTIGKKNVYMLGKIDDLEKWAWLTLADIFIMPTREIDGDYEGFGIVYLEAALANTPVIAGDSGGVKDAVKPAVSGILLDPENVDRIANAVITLAKDNELRANLAAQAKTRALTEFTWEKLIKKFYMIINN